MLDHHFLPLLHRLSRFNVPDKEAADLNNQFTRISNWDELLKHIELNGLSGIVLSHVNSGQFEVPKDVLIKLQALSMRHKAIMAARYKTLSEIQELFSSNNIKMVMLKGVALSAIMYDDISLRPMRDMDVLVSKDHLNKAASLLKSIGFKIDEYQPSRFMGDSHQLPDASKKVDGFNISVEVHSDAISRDAIGHLNYEQTKGKTQPFQWDDLTLQALGHEQMLHQVCRHLQTLHPGDLLKLINVMDVVGYSEKFCDEIDWVEVQKNYSHVINTLHCLHLIIPLSDQLQQKIGRVDDSIKVEGVGEIMVALKRTIAKPNSLTTSLKMIFSPSDWWLHLYYNTRPSDSLLWVKVIRHPLNLLYWVTKRLVSAIVGA